VPAQHVGMRATGDHLAVDEHAVAIKDDEIDWHYFIAQDVGFSSSSGTQ
jgi:hypothetical protein